MGPPGTVTTGTNDDGAHSWENVGAAAWTDMTEDADGNLISRTTGEGLLDISEFVRRKRKQRTRHDVAGGRRVVRDMIRYFYLVLDFSECMSIKDTSVGSGFRFQSITNIARIFVGQYFDQNPISHMGIIVAKNGEAELITQLSGNPKVHLRALNTLGGTATSTGLTAEGDFSLQNTLQVAGRSLGHMPRYGSREVLILTASLSTCDPGDLLIETLPRLKHAKIRVSFVSLTAEINICRRIANETDGTLSVCLDRNHLRALVLAKCTPPPVLHHENSEKKQHKKYCNFVEMGFPSRESSDVPTLIHVTKDKKMFARTGYKCPKCQAKAYELPTDCCVCGLKLVLSPHLARSFHHLFPVPPFQELQNVNATAIPSHATSLSSSTTAAASPMKSIQSSSAAATSTSVGPHTIDPSILVSSQDDPYSCFGCLKYIGPPATTSEKKSSSSKKQKRAKGLPPPLITDDAMSTSLRFQCPDCKNIFCADCDTFLHESLHNCPGCLCK